MMQNHRYSLTELEAMMPWEREIYIQMLMRHLEKEKDRANSMKNKMRR